MPLLLVLLLSNQVFGDSVHQPLTEDLDTLLISTLESPANFDPFPVYFEKKSQPSDSFSVIPTETILTSESLDSQSRFSPDSRPNPKPTNLLFKKNSSNHLKLEDYFGTPQPPTPTIANGLQASQLGPLSNIKIKHRSDSSPSAFRTSNKKKIIKKHLSKQKHQKKGHRGPQHSKYPKHAKKPIKMRILSAKTGDSMKKESETDQSGRKVGKDLVRFANDGDRNEDEKTNYLMEPIQTFDSFSSDLVARLGSESVATDFLGKLREMTGGQVVAVTRDKVHSKSEERSEEVKVNMIDAEQEIGKGLVKSTKSPDKKNIKKNISKFEDFPAADLKSTKPIYRRKGRLLKDTRTPEKQHQAGRKSSPGRFDKLRTKKSNKKLSGLRSVSTVSRYRYENADGSITWGYSNQDGSFKEETIGIDCVTHGRYGYVDPRGEAREYSYTSGIRCDPDTRKIEKTAGRRSDASAGHFDYVSRKFVMPDGRRLTVRVNQNKRARGKRS